jgi:ATP-dependent exoDNAse (exonuclease V) beta subunit
MSLTFISAGAGSGKTHTLMLELSRLLSSGKVRPSGVIATTFTKKAATELRERVRHHLLADEKFVLANAMAQARIGTVNSVCGALLERFAFEAGMAPQQQVLDEAQTSQLIRESIHAACTSAEVANLSDLAYRLGIEDWTEDLKSLLGQVRSNDIAQSQLAAFAKANADDLLSYFPKPVRMTLTQNLLAAIAAAMPDLQNARATSTVKKTQDYVIHLEGFERQLRNGTVMWSQWVSLTKVAPEKGLQHLSEPIQMLALAYDSHPELHADIRNYLVKIFYVCANALEHYRQRKMGMGVVDFTDQESLLLRLLDHPTVVESLREELDLLLVDEFQDTSPIQLALFLKLSRLARHTYWVGDLKQAIYGFRGSDTALMQSILQALPELGGTKQILNKSWRSRPALVNLVNECFTHTFCGTLAAEEVALSPQRPEQLNDPALVIWEMDGKNVDEIALSLVSGIQQLLNSDKRIPEKDTEVLRPLQARDIAILCRSNDAVTRTAVCLRQAGVPVATSQPGLLATPEVTLALACLRRLNDVSDTVATAEIIAMIDSAEPEVWLADRLRHLKAGGKRNQWKEEGADAHPAVFRIAQLRAELPLLAPLEALRRVMTACQIPKVVVGWRQDASIAQTRLANLESLIAMAAQYEDTCRGARQAATISGLLLWLGEQSKEGTDALAMPAVDAVRVLTHHAAKGLEWPVVILTDLEKEVHSRLWGITTQSTQAVNAIDPLQNRFIRYWPWPFGKQSSGLPVKDRIDESAIAKAFEAAAIAEAQRLLYVSMTRPRETLIFATKQKATKLPWLDTLGADWLTSMESEATELTLPSGKTVPVATMGLAPNEVVTAAKVEESLYWWNQLEPIERQPKNFNPSSAPKESVVIQEQVSIGERLIVAPGVDWSVLGTAVHACIAASLTDPSSDFSESDTSRMLSAFGVNASIDADALTRQVHVIRNWINTRWPCCKPLAETPLAARLENGQQIVGRIDLLLMTDKGIVVLDHKSTPSGPSQWPELAQAYAGQLFAYAAGVEQATNEKVVETWLVLPVAGAAFSFARA